MNIIDLSLDDNEKLEHTAQLLFTTLANVNLYPDIHSHMARFKGHVHPTSFYQKLGYVISGVVPDANGIGKPDIMMAKRVK